MKKTVAVIGALQGSELLLGKNKMELKHHCCVDHQTLIREISKRKLHMQSSAKSAERK